MLSTVTCAVTPPAPFAWTDAAWRPPALHSLIVYKAQVIQFNETFAGIV
jgi:hypothetical protein